MAWLKWQPTSHIYRYDTVSNKYVRKKPLMVSFQKHFNTGTKDLVTVKFIVNVIRDLVTVKLTVNKVFLKDYSGFVKPGKMLHSTCRNILRDFGSIFLNDVCSRKLHGRANHSGTKKLLFSRILFIYRFQQMSSSRGIYGINKLIIKCEIIMWVSWSRCVVVCWSPSMKLTPK